MAVYKIFADKDASINSYFPLINTGKDEILDLSLYKSIEGTGEVSRILINFPYSDITSLINTKVINKPYKAYIKLYNAESNEVPANYNIFCHPLTTSWTMGTGRSSDMPNPRNGVSWTFKDFFQSSLFVASGSNTTSSYATNIGGGGWSTVPNYSSSQAFGPLSNKDIELDITNFIIVSLFDSSLYNGFIIKHSDFLEFKTGSLFETKYFSVDTHTIYPPCLEIRWDDSGYVGTSNLSVISSLDNKVISLSNNKGEFKDDETHRFRVNVRDKYPTRTFQTSSVYLNNNIFPISSSVYAVKDIKTDEYVIDFDSSYTKLSADSVGNYFDLYLNGLQPERYYKILIKSTIGNNSVVYEDNNYFKIIK
jgi:hypothetical protein